jgi:hypothetical protein
LVTEFPADLYDAHGVIRFKSKAEYERFIRIGPEPNSTHADLVGKGISMIPGYMALQSVPSTLV